MNPPALLCPQCGAPISFLEGETAGECAFCGVTLDLHRSLCPACDFLNHEDQRYCSRCGEALLRVCPACGVENWAGWEICVHCNRPLDLLEVMSKSRIRDTRERLHAQFKDADLIKRREEAAGELRMEQFQEMERERLLEVARRNADRRKQERQIVAIILFVVAFVICLVVFFILLG